MTNNATFGRKIVGWTGGMQELFILLCVLIFILNYCDVSVLYITLMQLACYFFMLVGGKHWDPFPVHPYNKITESYGAYTSKHWAFWDIATCNWFFFCISLKVNWNHNGQVLSSILTRTGIFSTTFQGFWRVYNQLHTIQWHLLILTP